MRLRLIIPGLRWPGADRQAVHAGLRMPTLDRWWARGDRESSGCASASACIARAAGLPSSGLDTPHAAFSLRGEGVDPGALHWVRADPVPFHVGRTGLALAAASLPDLDVDEARALAAALRDHFGAELPRLEAPHPQRWYLGLPAAPGIDTVDPDLAVGEDVARGMPRGPERAHWLAFLNEVQMLWHGHPVNRAREARGQPPAASLWLHAAGTPARAPTVPWSRSCGFSPLLAGLALGRAGEHRHSPPDPLGWLLDGRPDEACALLSHGRDALWSADAGEWTRALAALDSGFLSQADRALARGRVREIRVSLPAPGGGLDLVVDRWSRMKLWRRPARAGFDA